MEQLAMIYLSTMPAITPNAKALGKWAVGVGRDFWTLKDLLRPGHAVLCLPRTHDYGSQ